MVRRKLTNHRFATNGFAFFLVVSASLNHQPLIKATTVKPVVERSRDHPVAWFDCAHQLSLRQRKNQSTTVIPVVERSRDHPGFAESGPPVDKLK
ncbi:MAG: hypothetical protein AB2L17_05455 [Lentimicrobium sp.]